MDERDEREERTRKYEDSRLMRRLGQQLDELSKKLEEHITYYDRRGREDFWKLITIIATIGIAIVAGYVQTQQRLEHLSTVQGSLLDHDLQQDRWIEQLNKKDEDNQAETRAAISHVMDLLNDVRMRLDGKYSH